MSGLGSPSAKDAQRLNKLMKKRTKSARSKPQAQTLFQSFNGTTEEGAQKVVWVDKGGPQRLEAALILRDVRHE